MITPEGVMLLVFGAGTIFGGLVMAIGIAVLDPWAPRRTQRFDLRGELEQRIFRRVVKS